MLNIYLIHIKVYPKIYQFTSDNRIISQKIARLTRVWWRIKGVIIWNRRKSEARVCALGKHQTCLKGVQEIVRLIENEWQEVCASQTSGSPWKRWRKNITLTFSNLNATHHLYSNLTNRIKTSNNKELCWISYGTTEKAHFLIVWIGGGLCVEPAVQGQLRNHAN